MLKLNVWQGTILFTVAGPSACDCVDDEPTSDGFGFLYKNVIIMLFLLLVLETSTDNHDGPMHGIEDFHGLTMTKRKENKTSAPRVTRIASKGHDDDLFDLDDLNDEDDSRPFYMSDDDNDNDDTDGEFLGFDILKLFLPYNC